jgi:hypothetical protein
VAATRQSSYGHQLQKWPKFGSLVFGLVLLSSCSPRDFLTRRLAFDLIAASEAFRTPQQFQLLPGIIANQDYVSPEVMALQHHGWISATPATCPAGFGPPPCWDMFLTPSGVETFQSIVSPDTLQSLVAPGTPEKQAIPIPTVRRELIAITGIAQQGGVADVEFTWKWVPLNEVGAALYPKDGHYRSSVGFRNYDDGWRVMEHTTHSLQPIDEALQNAEPN